MTLADFLLARIAEDEKFAVTDWPAGRAWSGSGLPPDPTRIAAECEAKRRIIEECRGWLEEPGDDYGAKALASMTLRLLALRYTDHPDYREGWRP